MDRETNLLLMIHHHLQHRFQFLVIALVLHLLIIPSFSIPLIRSSSHGARHCERQHTKLQSSFPITSSSSSTSSINQYTVIGIIHFHSPSPSFSSFTKKLNHQILQFYEKQKLIILQHGNTISMSSTTATAPSAPSSTIPKTNYHVTTIGCLSDTIIILLDRHYIDVYVSQLKFLLNGIKRQKEVRSNISIIVLALQEEEYGIKGSINTRKNVKRRFVEALESKYQLAVLPISLNIFRKQQDEKNNKMEYFVMKDIYKIFFEHKKKILKQQRQDISFEMFPVLAKRLQEVVQLNYGHQDNVEEIPQLDTTITLDDNIPCTLQLTTETRDSSHPVEDFSMKDKTIQPQLDIEMGNEVHYQDNHYPKTNKFNEVTENSGYPIDLSSKTNIHLNSTSSHPKDIATMTHQQFSNFTTTLLRTTNTQLQTLETKQEDILLGVGIHPQKSIMPLLEFGQEAHDILIYVDKQFNMTWENVFQYSRLDPIQYEIKRREILGYLAGGSCLGPLYQLQLDSLREYYGTQFEGTLGELYGQTINQIQTTITKKKGSEKKDENEEKKSNEEILTQAAKHATIEFHIAANIAIPTFLQQHSTLFHTAILEHYNYTMTLDGLMRDIIYMTTMKKTKYNDWTAINSLEQLDSIKEQNGMKKWYKKLAERLIVLGLNLFQGWLVLQRDIEMSWERDDMMPKFPLF